MKIGKRTMVISRNRNVILNKRSVSKEFCTTTNESARRGRCTSIGPYECFHNNDMRFLRVRWRGGIPLCNRWWMTESLAGKSIWKRAGRKSYCVRRKSPIMIMYRPLRFFVPPGR